jgi:hypothetical protein
MGGGVAMCVFFQVEAPVAVGAGAWGIATADLGTDNIPDVIVAVGGANEIEVLTSNGSGGFSSEATYAAGTAPTALATADFNNDGTADVVVANSASNSVSILLNNGHGGFTTAKSIQVGKDPTALATGALFGGHNQDIVVADSGASNITVLTGNGAGGFTSTSYGVLKAPDAVAIASLTGSSYDDIIVADGGANAISVLLHNGGTGFGKAVNYAVGTDPTAITTADLTGNGVQDVIVANGGSGTVSVLLNNGAGVLSAAQTYYVGGTPTCVAMADVNGDGLPDMIVGSSGSDQISVFLNEGSGFFSGSPLVYQLAAAPVSITTADVNSDGRIDILATLANGSVDVILNESDYLAAQAVAEFAKNPSLTSFGVADTGTNVGSNLDGLQTMAAAGVLSYIDITDFSPISLTSQQLFADGGALDLINAGGQNIIGYPQLLLTSGPLTLNGSLYADPGGEILYGTLTNTGSLSAATVGGSQYIGTAYEFGYPVYGTFQNNSTLTVSNGYSLGLGVNFANTGVVAVSGGALLTIGFSYQGETTTFANSGSISLNSAELLIYGSLSVPALTGISNTGGIIGIEGSLRGPGVLAVGGGTALGTVQLFGTISGTTITDSGGGLEFIGSTLDRGTAELQGDTYDGILALNLVGDSVTIAGGLRLAGLGGSGAGTVELTGNDARLGVLGATTLSNATIYIGGNNAAAPALLIANDPYQQGTGRLTLGTSLALVQQGLYAAVGSDRTFGDGVTNDGTIIAARAGGQFFVQGGTFSNQGTVVVGNGDTFWINADKLANLAGGTLTGGNWQVNPGSTLWLPDNANLVTDRAALTLAGNATAGPVVEWNSWTGATPVTLQQTLGAIGTGGALTLNGGWTFASTVAGGLDDLSHLTLGGATLSASSLTVAAGATLSGFGTVSGPITNSGGITALGGLLTLSGAVAGTGTLAIGTAATLEIGGSAPVTEKVAFAATSPGLLILGAPTADPVSVTGFTGGDTVELLGFTETSYGFTGGVLTVHGSGGGAVTLTFGSGYSQSSFSVVNSGGNTVVTDPGAALHAALAASAGSTDLFTPVADATPVASPLDGGASSGGAPGASDLVVSDAHPPPIFSHTTW